MINKNKIIQLCILAVMILVIAVTLDFYIPKYKDYRMIFSDFDHLKKEVSIQLEDIQYPNLNSSEIYIEVCSALTNSIYKFASIKGYEVKGYLFSDENARFRITVLNGVSPIEEYESKGNIKIQNRTEITDIECGKYIQRYQIIQNGNYEYQVYVSVQTTLQEDGLEELVDRIDKLIGLMMCPILE